MKIIEEFKKWLINEQKIASSTSAVYLVSVRNFLKYYHEFYKDDFVRLETDMVNGYSLKMAINNIPAATINTRITGLKKFNQFLVTKGYQKDIVIYRSHRVDYSPSSQVERRVQYFSLSFNEIFRGYKSY